jgi:hypothetical protein
MTSYYPFQPSSAGPFQFQPTLDGQQYIAVVTWNFFGQRFYLNLSDVSGNQVLSRAVIGSPDGLVIETLSWSDNEGTGEVTITTDEPHGWDVGQTVELAIDGASPDGWNGTWRMLATSETELTFPLSTNPGSASSVGTLYDDISLTKFYFDSSIIYRESSRTFEVRP